MILVTSDDGVDALGLAALRFALMATHRDHVVVANDCSWTAAGTSMAIPHGHPVIAESVSDVSRFTETPPALMVAAACSGAVGPQPHAVLSGVNHGPNVGRMTWHSGTVGAAIAAAGFGLPAVAVSSDDIYSTGGVEDGPLYLDAAAVMGVALLDIAVGLGRSGLVLNLNVPNLPFEQIVGIRTATCADVVPEVTIGASGALSLGVRVRDAEPDSDVALLSTGHATVTVLCGRVDRAVLADQIADVEQRILDPAKTSAEKP
jgi:5'-nucleotidase